MINHVNDLVRYRLERARETLEEVHILADAGHWNACVNRLYYTCFYTVSALLLRHSLSSARHSGVRSLFNQHFVKTGVVSRDLAQVYNDLFERRREGDYTDLVRFSEAQVRPWIPRVEAFVSHIASLAEREN